MNLPTAVPREVRLIPVPGIPMIRAGDDLASVALAAIAAASLGLLADDVLVFAQKVVSKAEGRTVDLRGVQPSERALELAETTGKDARLIEVILGESVRIVRAQRDVLIVEHRLGYVMANAGVDQSNVGPVGNGECALLLPLDPDASAAALRAAVARRSGVDVGVVVNDSFGRPWRRGTVGVAIGCAGLAPLHDLRGTPDLFGRVLKVTEVGHADEIAAAASLVMGQAAEATPLVIVRGLARTPPAAPAVALVRPAAEDLFR